MKDVKNHKKPLIYYYLIALLVVIILNATVIPMFFERDIKEVDYGTFLSMVDNKEIKEVDISSSRITFTPINEEDDYIYITGAMNDPGLITRLENSGVKFGREIPQESSPLLTFLLSWIFPILMFFMIGQLLSRGMQKRMGGNSMSFGKSNAKVYVSAQTGKSFKDVAGQDEAKEALTEIVDFLHNPTKYTEIGAKLPKGCLLYTSRCV